MYKRLLCAGVVALGLSGVAFANDDFDDNYSTTDATAAAADTTDSSYFNPGFYLGGQLGMTNMHYSGSDYTKSPIGGEYDDKYKFAFRGYAGYSFSQFISAELGYDYYGHPKFKNSNSNTQEILQHGFDLVAKASLPLDYGFALYMKGGLAWVHRTSLNGENNTFADKAADSNFTPVVALGVNYWFAPNIALDLGWTKTVGVSDLPTIDLFTLGFVYKINI